MRDQETSKRIRARINEALTACEEKAGPKCSPALLQRSRRAELLKRNDKFLVDRRKLLEAWKSEMMEREEQIAEAKSLTAAQREDEYMPSPEFLEGTKPGTTEEYEWALQDFCYRWGISDRWTGKLEDLDRYAIGEGQVIFREWSSFHDGHMASGIDAESIPLSGAAKTKGKLTYLRQDRAKRWADNVCGEQSFIYIKISPETHRKDLEKIWPFVEELKKRVFGFSDREKQTFDRDLCFWDLMHKPDEYGYGKLSAGGVKSCWNLHAPAGQRVKNTDVVKKSVKLIQGYIDRLTVLD